uniref:Uncharacterized protein n=1 Tax=viral metagenome TaxID=1070528 RepID=A0A6C0LIX2_9ZZZZ
MASKVSKSNDPSSKKNKTYFYTIPTVNNLKKYQKEHGTLEGMLKIDNKHPRTDSNDNVRIPILYNPTPQSDGKWDKLMVYSKSVHIHGKIFSNNQSGKVYQPELKQGKYTEKAYQNKLKMDPEKGWPCGILDGEEITDEDITPEFALVKILDEFIREETKKFIANDTWGKKKKCLIQVKNTKITSGLREHADDKDSGEKVEMVVPFITRKFYNREPISSPESDKNGLKILDEDEDVMTVTKETLNDILPTKTEIRIATDYSNICIGDNGISLNRFITELKRMKMGETKEKFSHKDSDDEEDVKQKEEDDDED